MEPNFENGEYLIINELGYKKAEIGLNDSKLLLVKPFKELARGEVIIFRYPKNPNQYFIKRIVGLPGEKIEIRNGEVYIYSSGKKDGFKLDEKSYLSSSVKTNGEMTAQLSDSEYFVLGDNRSYSSDSRSWGPLPKDNVIGKVLIRAWPFNRAEIY
jgi:signal peptidase I